MKHFWIVVLGLVLNGCTFQQVENGDSMSGNAQFAKSGGWSSSAVLRNNGTDNMGGAVDFLAGRNNNEIPSKNYTVQFSITEPKDANGLAVVSGYYNPVAEIAWSVEGNTVRRVISVTNGAAVTGVGQGVKIVVRDQTPQGVALPTSYNVGITVAPGSRPSENQPATYNPLLATQEGMLIVAPGSASLIVIPQNAGAISSYVTVVASDLITALAPMSALVDQVDVNGIIQRSYDPNIFTSFVPLMGQATKLSLRNNFPPGPGVPDLAFSITFGIDG